MKQEVEDNLNNYFTDQGCHHGIPFKCNMNQTVWETFRSDEPSLTFLRKDGQEIHLQDASLQLKAPGTHSF